MRRALVSWLLLAVVAGPGTAQTSKTVAELNGFDTWVESVMKEWRVPGVAVGAVKDGQVVLAKGYGYRDVEGRQPVTQRTVMAIGSNSKSFTVVLLGMLVDEDRLDWDRPVREYLPDFRLKDDFATREMTARDLVTHRSGLPRHDALWYGRSGSREDLYHRLRYLEPSASFRSRYQYQNLMFMTAGYLAERIAGRSWDRLIHERIFSPLGMTRSGTTVDEKLATDDYAFPYIIRNDSVVRVPFRGVVNAAPAGSIESSIDDMLKYIQFRIDQGQAGGKRLLSVASEQQMQSPQMVQGGGALPYDEIGHSQYGLGLGIGTYRGRKTVGHGGGIDGFISSMSWMPSERIGVMVLTNLSGDNPVPTLVQRQVYDRLLGLAPVDWVGRQRKQSAEAAAQREKARSERAAERKPGTRPSVALAAHAGRYRHPGYGDLAVRVDGDQLVVEVESLVARLKHFHYDVWEIDEDASTLPISGRITFQLDNAGNVHRVLIPFEPAVKDIEFERSR